MGSPYTTPAQLAAALAANPMLQVVTVGPGAAGIAKNILRTNNVTAVANIAVAFQMLTSGAPNAPVAVWDYSNPAPATYLARMLGSLSSRGITTFFRPPVLPAAPTPVATPTATPFNAVLSDGQALTGLAITAAVLIVLVVAAAVKTLLTGCCGRNKQTPVRLPTVMVNNALLSSPGASPHVFTTSVNH
jgi:hypothetical protein